MPFILPVLLSVMNCSFSLFMLLLSSRVADSPVSPCNVSCAACIFFPQGSYFYFYHLLLHCIVLASTASSVCSRFGLALHMLMYTQNLYDCRTEQLKYAQCFTLKHLNPCQICCFHMCCLQERNVSRAAGAMLKKSFSN